MKYMLEKYLEKQPVVTKLLLQSKNNNKLVQAYLLVSNDKNFLMQFSLDFTKDLITDKPDEKIYKMIDSNTYPELKIIEPKNNIIKKEQIIELQELFSVKPVLGKKLVYIIDGADKLHVSSSNTILKFLEEPSDDIVAILLTDNLQKVLPTIKSRCQVLSFNNNLSSEVNIIYRKYKEYYPEEEYNSETFNYLSSGILEFIKKLDSSKLKMFMYYKQYIFDVYKNKIDFMYLFDFMLYFYYDMLNFKLKRDLNYMNDYKDYIDIISSDNSITDIRKKIEIILNTKNNLNTNLNLKLLMDDFIINFSEVQNG